MILAVVLLYGVFLAAMNLLVDLTYGLSTRGFDISGGARATLGRPAGLTAQARKSNGAIAPAEPAPRLANLLRAGHGGPAPPWQVEDLIEDAVAPGQRDTSTTGLVGSSTRANSAASGATPGDGCAETSWPSSDLRSSSRFSLIAILAP